ncbi:MAG: zinc ABC transporter solute-binding protein [Firmicutes bacterium]|nr:zinc ABC transporter solute-binding protein [Bacillota bacterium]
MQELCRGMILLSILLVCSLGTEAAASKALSVFVSILPQKYLVERIAGDSVRVSVMVRPGADPVTYEPSPRQMAELAEAQAYFRIGVPFEEAWLGRIRQIHPHLTVIDTREGIKLRPITGHVHDSEASDRGSVEMIMDPHTWLSPVLAKRQAETIYKTLTVLDPTGKEDYECNYQLLIRDLDSTDQEIRSILDSVRGRKFMVFHPAWGYFADEYDLEQVPIEVEGKEPSAKELAQTIDQARRDGIKVIFVQSQFNTKPAETIARAVGGRIVQLDPLAEDYLANLVTMAKAIAAGAR